MSAFGGKADISNASRLINLVCGREALGRIARGLAVRGLGRVFEQSQLSDRRKLVGTL